MVKLIKNVSPYADLIKIDEAVSNGSEYFAIIDNGWCDIWESVGGEPLNNLSTTFGSVSYKSEDKVSSLFIHNSEENYLDKMNGGAEMPDVQIVTINRLTGEIVHNSSFAVTGEDSLGNVMATRVE